MTRADHTPRPRGRTPVGLRTLWLIAGLLVAAGPARADGRRVALLVGQNAGGAVDTPLRYAEGDARRMAAVLTELGDFAREDVTVLTATDADALRAAMRRLDARIAATGAGPSLLLFYYSGHATPDALQIGPDSLPLAEVKDWLRASGATVRLGLFDACHSGSVIRTKGGTRGPAFPIDVDLRDQLASEGYALLTSSSAGETSQESDELAASFFTHYLVSGLRGAADASGDGDVTLTELYHYAYNETVHRSASSFAGLQHPGFDYALSGRGDLVLSRLARAQGYLVLAGGPGGTFLVFSAPEARVVAEVVKPLGQPRRVAVPAGRYTVYRRDGRGLDVADVAVAAGATTTVDADRMTAVDPTRYALKGGSLVRRPWAAVGPALGVNAALDGLVRREIVQPALVWGVAGRLEDLLVDNLDLGLELLVGLGRQQLTVDGEAIGQDFLGLSAAVAFLWRFDLPRGFQIHLGPQAALRVMRRALDATATRAADDQWVVTATPAAVVRLGWQWRWLGAGLEGRAGYMGFRYESHGTVHTAWAEGLASLEFRFWR